MTESQLKEFCACHDSTAQEIVALVEQYVTVGRSIDKKAVQAIQRRKFAPSETQRLITAAIEGVICQKDRGNVSGMVAYADLLAEVYPRGHELTLLSQQ